MIYGWPESNLEVQLESLAGYSISYTRLLLKQSSILSEVKQFVQQTRHSVSVSVNWTYLRHKSFLFLNIAPGFRPEP